MKAHFLPCIEKEDVLNSIEHIFHCKFYSDTLVNPSPTGIYCFMIHNNINENLASWKKLSLVVKDNKGEEFDEVHHQQFEDYLVGKIAKGNELELGKGGGIALFGNKGQKIGVYNPSHVELLERVSNNYDQFLLN